MRNLTQSNFSKSNWSTFWFRYYIETPVLWPPHTKCWLIGKDSDAGRDWGQEEKGTTEDEMAGWHHRLNGRESEWTPGVGDGQGGLACCDSWGRKEVDTTEWLNWTELNWSKWACNLQPGGYDILLWTRTSLKRQLVLLKRESLLPFAALSETHKPLSR